MKIISSADPDRLELQNESVGCLVIIGLLLAMWGAGIIGVGVGVIDVVKDQPDYFYAVLLALGTALILLGLFLVFYRSGFIFDRRTGFVTKWAGPRFPLWKKNFLLPAYSQVRYGPSDDPDLAPEIFWLDLAGDPEFTPLTLSAYLEDEQAEGEALAAQVAEFLRLPLVKREAPASEEADDGSEGGD